MYFVLLLSFLFSIKLLEWLCHNPGFLNSWIGRRMIVLKAWADLNRTAFAFDSFEGSDKEQANESLAKSVNGRALSELGGKKTIWVPDADWPEYIHHPQERVSISCTYDYYLKHYEFKCGKDVQHPDYPAMKQKLWKFTEVGEPGARFDREVKELENVLQDKTMFSKPFLEYWDSLSDRSCALSFHTFGSDMSKAKTALNTLGKRWKEFKVNYGTDSNEPIYTEVLYDEKEAPYYDTRSYTETEFFDFCIESANVIVPLVQENYTRWHNWNKASYFGKKAYLPYRFTQITLGVVHDDLDCWCLDGVQLTQVSPWNAACEEGYFTKNLRPSSPLKSPAFWVYAMIMSLTLSIYVQICLIQPLVAVFSLFLAYCVTNQSE
jgi:hypothetical protein